LVLAKTRRLQALTSARWFLIDKIALWALGVGLLTMYSAQYRKVLSPGLALSIAAFVLASILLVLSVARLPFIRNINPGPCRSISYAAYVSYLLHRPIWRIAYLVYTPRTPTGTFLFTLTIGAPLVLFVSYALQKGYDLLTSNWRI
jgi:peptidoglycan/LPS O-acetylase OafA/YrhL